MNLTAKQQLSRNPQNAGYSNPIKTYPVPAVTNEDGTISVPAQPVYPLDPNREPIDMRMPTRYYGDAGIVTWNGAVAGTAITAGGRTLIVQAGKRWKLVSIISDYTATATVGNRVIVVQCGSNIGAGYQRFLGPSSAVVTAAQVCGYDVYFGSGGPDNTTVRRLMAGGGNTNVQVKVVGPALELMAGDSINIDDAADIDVADTVRMSVTYVEYDA